MLAQVIDRIVDDEGRVLAQPGEVLTFGGASWTGIAAYSLRVDRAVHVLDNAIAAYTGLAEQGDVQCWRIVEGLRDDRERWLDLGVELACCLDTEYQDPGRPGRKTREDDWQ